MVMGEFDFFVVYYWAGFRGTARPGGGVVCLLEDVYQENRESGDLMPEKNLMYLIRCPRCGV